jgi:hypothetical protein
VTTRLHKPSERPTFDPHHYGELTAGLIGPDGAWGFGPPADFPATALVADVETAAAMTCDRCGWAGGAFACFRRGSAYRAWMICAACGLPNQMRAGNQQGAA